MNHVYLDIEFDDPQICLFFSEFHDWYENSKALKYSTPRQKIKLFIVEVGTNSTSTPILNVFDYHFYMTNNDDYFVILFNKIMYHLLRLKHQILRVVKID